VAAAIGTASVSTADVAYALEAALTRRPSVVWSSFQECTGCAISILQSREPSVADLILRQISLDYQENIMAAAGTAAEEVFEQVTSGEFYWVVEGSVSTTIPEAIMIAGKTGADIVRDTYQKAAGTIAIGGCACYGNIQAAAPNPTGAKGIAEFLSEDAGVADPVVINVSRCPGNGEDLVAVLSYILVTGELPELDAVGRPVFLYGSTIHDNCYRRGHFDNGEFVEQYGDEGWAKDWCLYKIGCKGPVTYAPCGVTRWNGNVSWCVHNGPCTGCAEPEFWDDLTPFTAQAPGVDVPVVGGVSAEQIGIGLGIATAVGIGAHAVAQIATGRFGKGGPPEEQKGGEV
jgi:NiFe hydrogenase small subunit HydA